MKIRPVWAELYHVDGRTDMTELIVAFRNFANAHKFGSYRRRWKRINSDFLTWQDSVTSSCKHGNEPLGFKAATSSKIAPWSSVWPTAVRSLHMM